MIVTVCSVGVHVQLLVGSADAVPIEIPFRKNSYVPGREQSVFRISNVIESIVVGLPGEPETQSV